MTCADAQRAIDAFMDNELAEAESAIVREHMAACTLCRQALADRVALGRALRGAPYYEAPLRFRAALAASSRKRGVFGVRPAVAAWAAGLVLAVSIGGGALSLQMTRARRGAEATAMLADQVVDGHIRALSSDHLFDVRSSDQHTVKPWFLGKLDFSPPVTDLASIGFPLAGGRVDDVAGHHVAALVYQRRLHPINVFIWPESPDGGPETDVRSIRGFQTRHWTRDGMTFWAVSDLSDAELAEFVAALQR